MENGKRSQGGSSAGDRGHVPKGQFVSSAKAELVEPRGDTDRPRPAASPPEVDLTDENELTQPPRRRFWFAAVPSWLVSLLLHVLFILVLAAISLEPTKKVIGLLQGTAAAAPEALQEFELRGPELDQPTDMDQALVPPNPQVDTAIVVPELSTPLAPALAAEIKSPEVNPITESIIPSSLLGSSVSAQMTVALSSRSSTSKSEMLERYGGNAESEKAVRLALQWIAAHQSRRTGGWSFAHGANCRQQCGDDGTLAVAENAATAMALLPFLGAGQTHLEGEYKETVKRGLAFLINRMQVSRKELPEGSWHEQGGRMYSHGLAAITVCEAYAMTRDPDLLQPAQLSLNYLINSQDPRGGGWRYEPREAGDTSVVGWCLMALKSGSMGNLVVPQRTFQQTNEFLNFVSVDEGAFYGYTAPTSNLAGREATTAVGLLCRMYLGFPKEHPGMKKGIEYLSETGPKLNDLYYSYYATQVMRHYGGPEWENWNRRIRDQLVAAQVKEGHATGSWVTSGAHAGQGGRLYSTSLACMILEVYYRHMPLYSDKSSDEDFEL
jgi:hypothetical protein